MENYNIFTEPPHDFAPKVEVAGCYCEFEDKILFLRRHPEKAQGNTWGLPAGKLEKKEDPRMAVIREVYEEVGLKVDGIELEEVGKLYMRLPDTDFIFHMFRKRFYVYPYIRLELLEHLEAKWITAAQAMELPLIIGGREAINYYLQFLNKKYLS